MTPFDYPPEHLLHPGIDGVDRDVPVDLGGYIELRKESQLLRLAGQSENEDEIVRWVQYHLPESGQMVHRSAHVHLKKSCLPLLGEAAMFV